MRFARLCLVLTMLGAACSSGVPARCVVIVEDAVDVFQDLISAVDELDLSEVSAAGGELEVPGLDEIELRADALQRAADAEGCDEGDLRKLLTERVSRLEARTVLGQAVIEGIRQEGLFDE